MADGGGRQGRRHGRRRSTSVGGNVDAIDRACSTGSDRRVGLHERRRVQAATRRSPGQPVHGADLAHGDRHRVTGVPAGGVGVAGAVLGVERRGEAAGGRVPAGRPLLGAHCERAVAGAEGARGRQVRVVLAVVARDLEGEIDLVVAEPDELGGRAGRGARAGLIASREVAESHLQVLARRPGDVHLVGAIGAARRRADGGTGGVDRGHDDIGEPAVGGHRGAAAVARAVGVVILEHRAGERAERAAVAGDHRGRRRRTRGRPG